MAGSLLPIDRLAYDDETKCVRVHPLVNIFIFDEKHFPVIVRI
jgi:hypothetical protein